MKMTKSKDFLDKYLIPSKNDTKNEMIKKIALLSGIGVVVIGGLVTIIMIANHNKTEPADVSPSSIISSVETSAPSSRESSKESSKESSEESSEESSKESSKSTSSKSAVKPKSDGLQDKPVDAAETEGMLPQFIKPYSNNKTLKGQLTVPGTGIKYYIPQSKDNAYYLTRTFTHGKSPWGNPYLDFRCVSTKNERSQNLILYGHSNPKTGEQLQSFKNYKDVSFYQSNPTIKFDTPYEEGTYKIIGTFLEWTKPDSGYFRYQDFVTQKGVDDLNSYMANVEARSFYNTNVDYNNTDQFLTISTCQDTKSSNYNRFVTIARKVRPGESASVDTSGSKQLIVAPTNIGK